jgi:4-amino-4-deoxy-L-arabinose transferase-like glycosyltransferase
VTPPTATSRTVTSGEGRLCAGAVLALTPAATLVFRFDNPDAPLVLVMTLAAYTVTRAVESGLNR